MLLIAYNVTQYLISLEALIIFGLLLSCGFLDGVPDSLWDIPDKDLLSYKYYASN